MSIVRMAFCKWALKKGWSIQSGHIDGQNNYANKKGDVAFEKELFSQFLIEEARHQN